MLFIYLFPKPTANTSPLTNIKGKFEMNNLFSYIVEKQFIDQLYIDILIVFIFSHK